MDVDATKRARNDGADEQDMPTAMKMLQRALPLLKPAQADSPLSTQDGLELLLQKWALDAGVECDPPRSRPVPRVKERLKKRLMTKEVDVWNLVDNADPAEKQELVDAVRMLADPSGKSRAKLIEMYGARMEGGDGSVDIDDAVNARQRPESPAPVAVWEPTLEVQTPVVLYGLKAAGSAHFNSKEGVVVGVAVSDERYIVRLEGGGTVRARPCNVRPSTTDVADFLKQAHGFPGVAAEEVTALQRIHGEKRVGHTRSARKSTSAAKGSQRFESGTDNGHGGARPAANPPPVAVACRARCMHADV